MIYHVGDNPNILGNYIFLIEKFGADEENEENASFARSGGNLKNQDGGSSDTTEKKKNMNVRNVFKRRKDFFRFIWRNEFSTSKVKMNNSKYSFDYLLVLDFEATCDVNKNYVQEIIEFPCLKINTKTLEEESRFHKYVKPVIHPDLTPFCIDLTGIIQDMVDNEKMFPEVLEDFEKWREKENLTEYNSLYVTSGDWDLGMMLPDQCNLCNIPMPKHMMQWNNIKKTFAYVNKHYPRSLTSMVEQLGLEFKGRLHSGIVDCENIYAIAKKLIKDHNVTFQPTHQLLDTPHGLRVIKYS